MTNCIKTKWANRIIPLFLLMLLLLLIEIPVQSSEKNTAAIKLGESCMTSQCHSDLSKSKFLHGPMNFGQCAPCHISNNGRHEFADVPKGRNLCQTCHELPAEEKVVHPPYENNCTACHNVHGADERYFVKSGKQGCLQSCHQDFSVDQAFMHPPVSKGQCLSCHNPHQSENPKMLVMAPSELCISCHKDFLKSRGIESLPEGGSVHQPVKERRCTACHDPHGGDSPSRVPTDARRACGSCHKSFFTENSEFKYSHGSMIKEKSCTQCHDPHASKFAHLLPLPASDLCLNCHNKPIKSGSRTLPSIAKQLEGVKKPHGPIQQKDCTACHRPHGSPYFDILRGAYSENFYTPYRRENYAICFKCHDPEMIEEQTSTKTGFRNGDRNLHFLHTKQEKGRNCRVCHHEHGTNQPKLIRNTVKFGSWEMPLEFNKTETGGSCASACHGTYRYDQNVAVQNKQEKSK